MTSASGILKGVTLAATPRDHRNSATSIDRDSTRLFVVQRNSKSDDMSRSWLAVLTRGAVTTAKCRESLWIGFCQEQDR
jgi:hypothetical protein